MEILNDLTKCNFYYYILGGNKAYLIFNYLQLNKYDFNCVGDAFIRRQNIKLENKVVRFLNKNVKRQYNIINSLKSNYIINLDQTLTDYSRLGYLLLIKYLFNIKVKNFLYRKYEGPNIHANNDLALRLAANNGHLNIVQYLVSKGANIHALSNGALMMAAMICHLPIILYLFSIGANTDILTAKLKAKFNIN